MHTSTTQIISLFGSGYVPEDHGDGNLCYLSPTEPGASVVSEAVSTLTAAMLDELVKSLRGALSLRQGA